MGIVAKRWQRIPKALPSVTPAADGSVSCPSCKSETVAKLAASGQVQRYQCGKCFEEFTGSAPAQETPAVDELARKEETVANEQFECGKCGRPFRHEKRKGTHEKKCKGKPWKPKGARGGARRSSAPGATSGAAPGAARAVRAAIAELEGRRIELEAEMGRIDEAVGTLRQTADNLESSGGGVSRSRPPRLGGRRTATAA